MTNSFYPKQGDLIYADRGLYRHYGVYVDKDHVIHFSPKRGFELSSEDAIIQETSLEAFLKGDAGHIDVSPVPAYPPDETVRRARSLVGRQKGEYNLIFFNCEHFARWCKTGELKSRQVETGLKVAGGIAATAAAIAIAVGIRKRKKDGTA
ncbi:hypothetical protein FACS189496_1110 [Bacilli bacterium]|nr:hypothetical protein FACS189496_1110 [Bacilli bacterium]